MRTTSLVLGLILLMSSTAIAQIPPTTADLVGAWQVISRKNLSTGTVSPADSAARVQVQFTRSHWSVLDMQLGRKRVSDAEYQRLTPEAQKAENYQLIWTKDNEQIFAARGGTYRLEGNKLLLTPQVALQPGILGSTLTETILRLDRQTMVTRFEPDFNGGATEITYKRID